MKKDNRTFKSSIEEELENEKNIHYNPWKIIKPVRETLRMLILLALFFLLLTYIFF